LRPYVRKLAQSTGLRAFTVRSGELQPAIPLSSPTSFRILLQPPSGVHYQCELICPPVPPAMSEMKESFYTLKTRVKRALRRSQDGWLHLTSGLAIEELWTQFRMEAGESSRLYKQDIDHRPDRRDPSWKRPFRIAATLFWSVLKKLSPARRVFLLFTMLLAFLSVIGFHFLFFTQSVEFILAFSGLLLLLALVIGDHISMKRDIEIARDIQLWLVPRRAPDIAGVDIAFATRPAKTVGGDYYDAFRRASDGPLLLAVGDVSGKGIPAAMLMATFQAGLRALGGTGGSLSELGGSLNRQVCANSQNGRFTTAFLAELNPATGELSYICAGHNPPILKREDGTVERLTSENIPLGIELKEDYTIGVTHLHPHDLLVIYTDGVTEARNEDHEEFGEARLLARLNAITDERAALVLSSVMQFLDEFVGSAPQHDDITCLVVRRS
jgi:serine phosphatase RsbU (regulator of sigma subunit)